jgi:hypothetical protein
MNHLLLSRSNNGMISSFEKKKKVFLEKSLMKRRSRGGVKKRVSIGEMTKALYIVYI